MVAEACPPNLGFLENADQQFRHNMPSLRDLTLASRFHRSPPSGRGCSLRLVATGQAKMEVCSRRFERYYATVVATLVASAKYPQL